MKKQITFLTIVAFTLTTLAAVASQAGIIFAPAGIGIILIIYGSLAHSLGLIILGSDPQKSQDSIRQSLQENYSFIEDQTALSDLAALIYSKASVTPANSEGKIEIHLSSIEIQTILQPTGLLETEPQKIQAMIEDLQ